MVKLTVRNQLALFAECQYAESSYAECRYAEWHGAT